MDATYRNMLQMLFRIGRRKGSGSVVYTANGLPYTGDIKVILNQDEYILSYNVDNGLWQSSIQSGFMLVLGISRGDDLWHLYRVPPQSLDFLELAKSHESCLNPCDASAWDIVFDQVQSVSVEMQPPGDDLWSVDNGATWNKEGVPCQLRRGSYTVTFHPYENYATPAAQSLTLGRGEAKTLECTYTPLAFPSQLLVSSTYGGAALYCGTYQCQGDSLEEYKGVLSTQECDYTLSRETYEGHGLCWVISSAQSTIYHQGQTIHAYAETDIYSLPTQVAWHIVDSPDEPISVTEAV